MANAVKDNLMRIFLRHIGLINHRGIRAGKNQENSTGIMIAGTNSFAIP